MRMRRRKVCIIVRSWSPTSVTKLPIGVKEYCSQRWTAMFSEKRIIRPKGMNILRCWNFLLISPQLSCPLSLILMDTWTVLLLPILLIVVGDVLGTLFGALLGVVLPLGRLIPVSIKDGFVLDSKSGTMIGMSVLSLVLLVLGIRSFIAARRGSEAG